MLVSRKRWLVTLGRLLSSATVLASSAFAWSDEIELTLVDDTKTEQRTIVVLADGEPAKLASGYWIGLACEPVDDETRKKLKLDQGLGLKIEQVFPDSPAAKAGLKQGDVITAVVGKPLASVQQLVEAIAGSNGQVLQLQVARDGERRELEVTPAKRDGELRAQVLGDGAAGGGSIILHPAPGQSRPAPGAPMAAPPGAGVPGMRVPNPGAMMPGAPMQGGHAMGWAAMAIHPPTLPDDMKVTIHKQGKQPATIVCEQGAKLWKTTENELEMLPAEARAYASRLLGRPVMHGPVYTPTVPGGLPAGARMRHLEGSGLKIEIHETDETKQPAERTAPSRTKN